MKIFSLYISFPLILTLLTSVSGFIALLDKIYFFRKRTKRAQLGIMVKESFLVRYSKSLFPVFLLVFIVRSFVAEPFRIPTGSLEPTLLVGDFILVNKFTYGIRFPVGNRMMVNVNAPKRGDIMVFQWPANSNVNFVKRVIGLPGDHIQYKDDVIYVNNVHCGQNFVEDTLESEGKRVEKRLETIGNVTHYIYVKPDLPAFDFDIVVPKGHYFVLGDNRSFSADSRYWGFVPDSMVIGKAFAVWMSWDHSKWSIRWNKIFKAIH